MMNTQSAVIKAVCISEKKGQQKHPIESVHLRPEHGIDGDAHAGNWHRQVSPPGKPSGSGECRPPAGENQYSSLSGGFCGKHSV